MSEGIAIRPIYHRVMHYTIQVNDLLVLEVPVLDTALRLFRDLRAASSQTAETVNLVAWVGRSGPSGGPPTGYIIDQFSWESS